MKNAVHACLGILAALATAGPVSGQTKEVVDPDSAVSLEIPAGWESVDLGNRDASLPFGDPEEDAFVMVIVEEKSDMFGWNLSKTGLSAWDEKGPVVEDILGSASLIP